MTIRSILSQADYQQVLDILDGWREPDVDIQPDGTPYLYRWHLIPRRKVGANCYLHLQVASDPERPLHDHPWDNHSVILAGGYVERMQQTPPWGRVVERPRHKGEAISRRAEEAHRLILPEGTPYTLTLFTTGPVLRDWGFWINNHRGRPEWYSHERCIVDVDGKSTFKRPKDI